MERFHHAPERTAFACSGLVVGLPEPGSPTTRSGTTKRPPEASAYAVRCRIARTATEWPSSRLATATRRPRRSPSWKDQLFPYEDPDRDCAGARQR